jgi:hypothetical protein
LSFFKKNDESNKVKERICQKKNEAKVRRKRTIDRQRLGERKKERDLFYFQASRRGIFEKLPGSKSSK